MALFDDREAAMAVTEKLKVFAQPQRLMILSCLLRGERNVSEIDEATGIGQPALSQQLAALRRAELVRTRKEAKQVWYALADEDVTLCVRHMEAMFGPSRDLTKLPDLAVQPRQKKQGDQASPRPGTAGFARIL